MQVVDPEGLATVTGQVRLMGVSVVGAGTAGTVTIYDALTLSGSRKLKFGVAANRSRTIWFAPQGIAFDVGLSAETTGSASCRCYYLAREVG